MIDTETRSFTSPQVAALAGISYRQLDYWRAQGVLTPSSSSAHGSGINSEWTAGDVRLARVVGELLRLRVEGATIRLVPEVLEHHCGEGWLLIGPGRARLCTITELVDALNTDEPSWHVLRLSTILHGLPTTDDPAAA